MDDPDLLPQDITIQFWWEVWLPVRGSGQRQSVVADFRKLAELAGCTVSREQANFPERTVLLMYGSQQQFSTSVMTLNCVAELRRAKDTAEFFDGMAVDEQRQWMDDMVGRVQFAGDGDVSPRICLLDSGVNRGHPLLSPLMVGSDMHAVDPAWGTDDRANHGTGLAGLAAYGDLTEALAADGPVHLAHRLESVKLTPGEGANPGDAEHHAYLFAEAVSRPEIAAPQRRRVFMSAVTASDYRDRGRSSSWSSAVDGLAADADGAGQFPRLFILSAGNTREHDAWVTYPASLSTNLVHDPGQAWNAITVGACTDKVDTENAAIEAVAAKGGLSPYTTTSRTWDSAWPLKPDVVFWGTPDLDRALWSAGNSLTDVQRPLDATTDDFVARVNAAAERDDEGDPVNPKDPDWYLGDRQRHRGSLHQDVWEGTAAELASRGFIAVYPSAGWWRTRPALERYDLPARYSLVVSIRTDQTDIDLYTVIAQKLAIEIVTQAPKV